jgi:glycine/D-amino acid oxidase-like deaminating enzyme
VPLLERRVRQWQELGANTEMIEPGRLQARLGTDYYAGAFYDPRGGSLNPLAFTRGLAVAAQRAGVRLFERTPAIVIEQLNGRWAVKTPGGMIQSDNVVCCTNAYNLDVDAMRGVVIPLRTAQVASAPLSEDQASRILPGGESASDTQRLLTSFRLTADNRLIMGGASATAGDEHPGLFSQLQRSAQRRFPHLDPIAWDYAWSGYLALTQDHLPKIYKCDNGFWAGIGCNGRGIAMATGIGQLIAGLLAGQPENDCVVPIEAPRRIRGFGFRRPAVAAAVVLNRVFDVAERRLSGGS